ncbi:MAG: DUF488 domain-containing protein [Synergistaceae bacterium]|nr:DUF488 domain-containing protein [Synergistaceae bacterium]
MANETLPQIFTIGHSTRPLDLFISILKSFGINFLVDVRTIPRSWHNPQFNKETLPAELALQGIGYLHMTGLGGLRKTRPDSLNQGWHNASFRGYADYMQTDEFKSNLKTLIDMSAKNTLVIMCAETLPWRCHRSLIADALLIRGIKVQDIFKEGVSKEHRITSFAQVRGTEITYPAIGQ